MKRVLLVLMLTLAMVFAFAATAMAADLTIDGEVNTVKEFSVADLEAMETVTATYSSINSSGTFAEDEFTGVPLADLLAAAGLKSSEGYLILTASDGYTSKFELADLEAQYVNGLVPIVAFIDGDKGPLQMIIPQKSATDVNKSSWASMLVKITVFAPPTPVAGFVDVLSDHDYAAYIADIVEKGITTGTTATTFSPDSTLTRAQFATFIGRHAGIDTTQFTDMPFTDVTAAFDWAKGYIAWAAKAGITTGTTATTFAPAGQLTREQMATLIYRYADVYGIELAVVDEELYSRDNADVTAYAKEAVEKLIQTGMLELKRGDVRPQDPATRAEMALALSLLGSPTKDGLADLVEETPAPAADAILTINGVGFSAADIAAITDTISGTLKNKKGEDVAYIGYALTKLYTGALPADTAAVTVVSSDGYTSEITGADLENIVVLLSWGGETVADTDDDGKAFAYRLYVQDNASKFVTSITW
ncbi:MAG: S-layer homology domain-containing protein [Bacillota bacterium]|nr:S-layer homology domain-containing protein [Bacillota bacterium]